MRVHEVEPDPRDRVRILLEMSRLDIETPDPLSQVLLFEPLVKEHPEHLPLCITVGTGADSCEPERRGPEIARRGAEATS